MLFLDVDGILNLLITEQLEAFDFGNLVDRLIIVGFVETLLVCQSNYVLVLDPFVDLPYSLACIAIRLARRKPRLVTRLKQDAKVLRTR